MIGQGLIASFAIDHYRSSLFWLCVRSVRRLYHIHDFGDCRDVKLWSKIIEMVIGIHELTDYWLFIEAIDGKRKKKRCRFNSRDSFSRDH